MCRWGPRFFDMTHAHSPRLVQALQSSSLKVACCLLLLVLIFLWLCLYRMKFRIIRTFRSLDSTNDSMSNSITSLSFRCQFLFCTSLLNIHRWKEFSSKLEMAFFISVWEFLLKLREDSSRVILLHGLATP